MMEKKDGIYIQCSYIYDQWLSSFNFGGDFLELYGFVATTGVGRQDWPYKYIFPESYDQHLSDL